MGRIEERQRCAEEVAGYALRAPVKSVKFCIYQFQSLTN